MPGVVLDFIHKYKDMFTDSLKKKIIGDIENARSLGSFDDPERWNTLKKELLKEVGKKGETL